MSTRISELKPDAEVRRPHRSPQRPKGPSFPMPAAPPPLPDRSTESGSPEPQNDGASRTMDEAELERAREEGRLLEIGWVLPPEPESRPSPEAQVASLQRLGLDLRLGRAG